MDNGLTMTMPDQKRIGTRQAALGVALLIAGLIGHLMAANAEGGRAIHYRHHIFGFFLLTVVSALIVWALSLRFWRGRHGMTLVIVGALQAVFGLIIYLMFSSR